MCSSDLIKKLTENLSLYLRYIVNTRKGYATLKEEIEHIRHYLNIMQIRFGESFTYIEAIDETLGGTRIPPLSVQLVIENTMKYAFDIYGNTTIELHVYRMDQEVVICVQDNGSGYPQEVIDGLQERKAFGDEQVGLWNIKLRLESMYKERAYFKISNVMPHGAKTEIHIREEERV